MFIPDEIHWSDTGGKQMSLEKSFKPILMD